MPVIWDKAKNSIEVPNDFIVDDSKILAFEANEINGFRFRNMQRKPKIMDMHHGGARGSIINKLIISHETWDRFRYSMMWSALAPCILPGGVEFTDDKINGLIFYKLDESFRLW